MRPLHRRTYMRHGALAVPVAPNYLPGIVARYDNLNGQGGCVPYSEIVANPTFDWQWRSPWYDKFGGNVYDNWNMDIRCYFKPPKGLYSLQSKGDDRWSVKLDGVVILENFSSTSSSYYNDTLALDWTQDDDNHYHLLEVHFEEGGGDANWKLLWYNYQNYQFGVIPNEYFFHTDDQLNFVP